MRRLNIKDAFVGEPTGSEDASDEEGDEAVVLAVRGGEVVIVVSPGTPDDKLLDGPPLIRGALRLENERILSFEIQDGATGAFVEDESAEMHRRRQETGSVGLSSIEGPTSAPTTTKRSRDVMSSEVICTSPEVSVQELSRLLSFHNVSALPVVDEAGRVVGVASEADVIGKRGARVSEIMTRNLITADEDATLESVAQLMRQHRVKRVLIMRGEKLVGLVSRADLVRALAGG
jgi:CBS domain-containing protein